MLEATQAMIKEVPQLAVSQLRKEIEECSSSGTVNVAQLNGSMSSMEERLTSLISDKLAACVSAMANQQPQQPAAESLMAMAEGQNSGGATLHSHPGTCATRVFPKDFILPRQVNMAVAFQRWHLGNAQKKIHPFKRATAKDCYVPKKPANDASGAAEKKYTEAKSSRARLTKWKGVMDGYMSMIKDDPAVYVANPTTAAQVTKMYKAASKKAADKVKATRAAKLAAANAALPAGAKPKKSRKRPIEARSPVTMYEYFIDAGIIKKKKKRTEE